MIWRETLLTAIFLFKTNHINARFVRNFLWGSSFIVIPEKEEINNIEARRAFCILCKTLRAFFILHNFDSTVYQISNPAAE